VAFLCAALTLAALAERSGLAQRAAGVLAGRARGNALALYVLVCVACALLTAMVSLDGAVVLMLPLLLTLARRFGAPFAPLFLGVVVVANAASIAVPQGNPTNLVVISRLGISPGAFLGHMLVPGLGAAALCAAVVAVSERRALAAVYTSPSQRHARFSAAERHAALSLGAAALAAWASPLVGVAPWWPFVGAVAVSLALTRERPQLVVPWRISAQVAGLLIVTQALHLHAPAPIAFGLPVLAIIAIGLSTACALANNLPVSVGAAALLTSGPSAYAASIGLAVGSLATPQGSVATLIAAELAGANAPPFPLRRFGPLAVAAVLIATLLLWATS
jgi:arsenical pump membrane protein